MYIYVTTSSHLEFMVILVSSTMQIDNNFKFKFCSNVITHRQWYCYFGIQFRHFAAIFFTLIYKNVWKWIYVYFFCKDNSSHYQIKWRKNTISVCESDWCSKITCIWTRLNFVFHVSCLICSVMYVLFCIVSNSCTVLF